MNKAERTEWAQAELNAQARIRELEALDSLQRDAAFATAEDFARQREEC